VELVSREEGQLSTEEVQSIEDQLEVLLTEEELWWRVPVVEFMPGGLQATSIEVFIDDTSSNKGNIFSTLTTKEDELLNHKSKTESQS